MAVRLVTREEVNFQPAESTGGENYAWPCMAGFSCHGGCDCDDPTLTLPVRDYGRTDGRVVIGGYVYRGQAIRDLRGTYFHADWEGQIWSFRMTDGELTEFENRTFEFQQHGQVSGGIVSFGEDGAGEMHIATLGGTVYKNVPDGLALGDMNGDGLVEMADIGPFLLALFDRDQYLAEFPQIDPAVTGDINGAK